MKGQALYLYTKSELSKLGYLLEDGEAPKYGWLVTKLGGESSWYPTCDKIVAALGIKLPTPTKKKGKK